MAGSSARSSSMRGSSSRRAMADINVVPFPPLIRKLRSQDLIVLKDRRAGNRGRAKPKT